jgi:outer membrane protein assembly factor BamB
MNKFIIILFFISLTLHAVSQKQNQSEWRGPGRDGVYNEVGLLKSWPQSGPNLLWSFEGLGYGHSSPAVYNNKVYVTGITDTISTTGTLFVFDLKGKMLWKKEYGPDFCLNFHGTRATPVIEENRIYITSGMGAVYCLNAENGEKIWSVDFIKDLGVDSVIQFGYSESVLLHGEKLFCVPGSKENNVVALNKLTGKKIWSSKGVGEPATYNSPVVIKQNDKELLIAMTSGSIMGFDIGTGEMYWRVPQFQDNKIHANTPLYYDGALVVSSASRRDSSGLVQLLLSDDGKSARVNWRYPKFINLMGGIVRINDFIFSSAYLKNDWQVIDWKTGAMLQQSKDLGGGNVVFADGLFYCYAERDGEVALVDANRQKIQVISKFKVPLGTKEHWAHLVIADGKLFVRHGDALMVYDIRQK